MELDEILMILVFSIFIVVFSGMGFILFKSVIIDQPKCEAISELYYDMQNPDCLAFDNNCKCVEYICSAQACEKIREKKFILKAGDPYGK